jgi:ribosomal protein L37E
MKNRIKSNTCLNCGRSLRKEQNYCPDCGQENDQKIKSTPALLKDFLEMYLLLILVFIEVFLCFYYCLFTPINHLGMRIIKTDSKLF